MSKKKEYNNIFAKLAEEHNKVVPILRSLKLRTVKIRNTRILSLRDSLEIQEKVVVSIDLLTEYIATNYFILELLDKKELDVAYDLIKSKDKENVFIAANLLFMLIEEKKVKLLENNK